MSNQREQAPYPQGGEVKQDTIENPTHTPDPKDHASWKKGDKGQGGHGQSHGYGGSEGDGTGSSGPDEEVEI